MASTYTYILKFDTLDRPMGDGEGLPLAELGELLKALSKAVQTDGNETLVLQDVVHASYGLMLQTTHQQVHQHLQVIHNNVGAGRIDLLNSDERAYALRLKSALGGRYQLNAYDPNSKSEPTVIQSIELPDKPLYYYEKGTVYGTLISIGSRGIDKAAYIRVDGFNHKIEIRDEQEDRLISHYKKGKLQLTVKKKIALDSDKIEAVVLENFEAVSQKTFSALSKTLFTDQPEGIFNDIDDTIAYLRNRPDPTDDD